MKQVRLILFYFLLTLSGKTQTNRTATTSHRLKESMDTLVQSSIEVFMNDTSRVGVSVGIFYNGRTYSYNYGSTEKGKNIKPTNLILSEFFDKPFKKPSMVN